MQLRRLLIGLMLLLVADAVWAEATVWIAVSQGNADYAQAAEELRNQFASAENPTTEVAVKPWNEVAQGIPASVRAIVVLGSPALAGLAESGGGSRLGKVPLVAAMLPRSAYEALRHRFSNPSTAVVLDQPLVRQMSLLRLAFPHLRRVGVLLGPDAQSSQTALERVAQEQGLQLNAYRASNGDTLYPVLERALEDSDVLLAVPDAAIYNSSTIQNILLSSYRQRVPMIGFSPAYVRAGAILGLYSSPTQIAVQTSKLVRALLAGGGVPPIQSPVDFTISVNANVARSLGFRLSEDALRIQMQGREAQ